MGPVVCYENDRPHYSIWEIGKSELWANVFQDVFGDEELLPLDLKQEETPRQLTAYGRVLLKNLISGSQLKYLESNVIASNNILQGKESLMH